MSLLGLVFQWASNVMILLLASALLAEGQPTINTKNWSVGQRAVELLLNALERLGLPLGTVRNFLLGEEQTTGEDRSRESEDNDAPLTSLEGTTREICPTIENSKTPQPAAPSLEGASLSFGTIRIVDNKFACYQISVVPALGSRWEVWRRMADMVRLKATLTKMCGVDVELPPLPHAYRRSFDASHLMRRRRRIERFLQAVMGHPSLRGSDVFLNFLSPNFASSTAPFSVGGTTFTWAGPDTPTRFGALLNASTTLGNGKESFNAGDDDDSADANVVDGQPDARAARDVVAMNQPSPGIEVDDSSEKSNIRVPLEKRKPSLVLCQEGNLTQDGNAHEIAIVSPKSGVKPKISSQGENEHQTSPASQVVDNEMPAPAPAPISQEETEDGDGDIPAVGDASDRGASTDAEISWGGDTSVSSSAPLSPQGASPRNSGRKSMDYMKNAVMTSTRRIAVMTRSVPMSMPNPKAIQRHIPLPKGVPKFASKVNAYRLSSSRRNGNDESRSEGSVMDSTGSRPESARVSSNAQSSATTHGSGNPLVRGASATSEDAAPPSASASPRRRTSLWKRGAAKMMNRGGAVGFGGGSGSKGGGVGSGGEGVLRGITLGGVVTDILDRDRDKVQRPSVAGAFGNPVSTESSTRSAEGKGVDRGSGIQVAAGDVTAPQGIYLAPGFKDGGASHDFFVRGPSFATDGSKFQAGPALFPLVYAEAVVDDGNQGSLDARIRGRLDHVATLGRCRKKITELLTATGKSIGVPGPGVDHVAADDGSAEGPCPFLFLINFQIPGDPPLSMVAAWAVHPEWLSPDSPEALQSFFGLFYRFIDIPLTSPPATPVQTKRSSPLSPSSPSSLAPRSDPTTHSRRGDPTMLQIAGPQLPVSSPLSCSSGSPPAREFKTDVRSSLLSLASPDEDLTWSQSLRPPCSPSHGLSSEDKGTPLPTVDGDQGRDSGSSVEKGSKEGPETGRDEPGSHGAEEYPSSRHVVCHPRPEDKVTLAGGHSYPWSSDSEGPDDADDHDGEDDGRDDGGNVENEEDQNDKEDEAGRDPNLEGEKVPSLVREMNLLLLGNAADMTERLDDTDEEGSMPGSDSRNMKREGTNDSLCDFRSRKLKLLTKIMEGPPAVRRAMPPTSLLIGNKAEMRCFRSDKYVEVDVDFASALPTSQLASLCRRHANTMTLDLGLVLHGETENELPESVLGVLRVEGLDLTHPSSLWKDCD